jgi:hypothetical protein
METATIAERTHPSMTRNCDINVSYRIFHSLTTLSILESFASSGMLFPLTAQVWTKTAVDLSISETSAILPALVGIGGRAVLA